MQKCLSQNEQVNIDSLTLQVKHGSAGLFSSVSSVPGKVVDIKEDWDDILNNNDVKHLHVLCLLVQLGPKVADEKLMNSFYKSLGHVHNARWITAASNVLVLYMQEEEPSKDLVLLVTFIASSTA